MASLSLLNHSLPSSSSFSTTKTLNPKTQFSQCLVSSHSQFYGLKLSSSSSATLPSTSSKKLCISAKACAFRDSYEKFKKAGAQVVGISGDSPESHKAFAKKFRLPYTLLSDEGNKIRKEWGVPSDLFGTLPGRQTYVLDKNGVVQYIYNNQFQPEKHIDETLKILQSL
ncbi:hypothetical protein MKW94_007633 [Papaver nudicaule]|uniref:thioredoxin-dependent peroxiredoxin n=1 Tax=Papaver nudicaule TaxID=74823 RepID=A0AA41V0K0_PAPNU|nr:hypothetical protein [Papaver nudicaule]